MLDSANELLSQISETVVRQTVHHVEPARTAGVLLSRVVRRNNLLNKSFDEFETIGMQILSVHPQISSLFLGDEEGNYTIIKRSKDGGYSYTQVNRHEKQITIVDTHVDIIDRVSSTTRIASSAYDHREKSWYINSKNQRRPVWSTGLGLDSSPERGLASVHAIFDQNYIFNGSLGVKFNMSQLGELLKSLRIGGSGIAFIIDTKGTVLAYPETSGLDYNVIAPRSPVQSQIRDGWVRTAIDEYLISREQNFIFRHGDTNYIANFKSFPEHFGQDWSLGIVVPRDEFIEPVARTHETTILFSFWLLIIGGFLTSALSRELTEPIKQLTQEARKVRALNFEDEVEIISPVQEIKVMADAVSSMKKALKAFKKYVPSEIVQGIVSSSLEAKLEAQQQNVTVMFTDIFNFCSIVEKAEPAELMSQLSSYFDLVSSIIHENGGTIDKYIGDSVMAFWNADNDNFNHSVDACKTAVQIKKALIKLNEEWKAANKPELKTRIGINSGRALVGNFGSSDRFNYTAVGDAVNVASRLENLNKLYETKIIVSEKVKEKAEKDFVFIPLDIVMVRGRTRKVNIYQLAEVSKEISDNELQNLNEVISMFNRAVCLYLSREWLQAIEVFNRIISKGLYYESAQIFINRCEYYLENPPEKDWDGVFKQETHTG